MKQKLEELLKEYLAPMGYQEAVNLVNQLLTQQARDILDAVERDVLPQWQSEQRTKLSSLRSKYGVEEENAKV